MGLIESYRIFLSWQRQILPSQIGYNTSGKVTEENAEKMRTGVKNKYIFLLIYSARQMVCNSFPGLLLSHHQVIFTMTELYLRGLISSSFFWKTLVMEEYMFHCLVHGGKGDASKADIFIFLTPFKIIIY